MTRIKSLIGAVAATAVLVLGSAGVASAYPPAPPTPDDSLPVSPPPTADTPFTADDNGGQTTFAPGQVIILSIGGLEPGSTANFYILSTPTFLGSATANSEGVATLSAKVPASFSGAHTIRAEVTLADGTKVAYEQAITVAGDIVDTGSNTTGTTLQIAAIALAAGLGMLGLAAIRRRSTAVAA